MMRLFGIKPMVQWKRPFVLTALFCFICGSILITLFSTQFTSRYYGYKQLENETAQYEAELELLLSLSDPDPLGAETMQSAFDQVPAREEFYRFLLDLHEIESKVKVVVDQMDFGEAKLVRSLATGGGQAGDPSIYEQEVSMSLEGTYSEVTGFMEQLHQLERIINITKWNITVAAPPPAPTEEAIPAQERPIDERFRLEVTCSLYYTEYLAMDD